MDTHGQTETTTDTRTNAQSARLDSGTHTPGPWKIDDNEQLPLAVIQDNEDGEGICEIGKPDSAAYSATQEQWSNARLIAAAPDLLAACKRAIEEMQGRPRDGWDAVQGCEDAIDKAEGSAR